jgi:hypothetical protein
MSENCVHPKNRTEAIFAFKGISGAIWIYSPHQNLAEKNIRLLVNKWNGGDWIDLAQDRDQWRVLANTVMNLRIQ